MLHKKTLAACAVLLCTLSLWGTTCTWKGTTSTAWDNSANWDTPNAPGIADDVIIPAGCTNYPTIEGVSVKTITVNATATITLGNGITTTGDQTYNGPVNISGDCNMYSGGIFTFSAMTGAYPKLNTASKVIFKGIVNVGSLNVFDGMIAEIHANIKTLSEQIFSGPVLLGNGTASGTITLTTGSHYITFDSTIDSTSPNYPMNLILDEQGNILTFSNPIGSTGPLASFTVGSATKATQAIINVNITTAGAQTYWGDVTFNDAPRTLTSGTDIIFKRKVDSPNTLEIKADNKAVFLGDVTLPTLSVSGKTANVYPTITIGGKVDSLIVPPLAPITITTTDSQEYNGPVIIAGDVTLKASAVTSLPITFYSTIDGSSVATDPKKLTILAGSAAIEFPGAVGGTTPLQSLTVGNASNITKADINANITTTGNQIYTGDVKLFPPSSTATMAFTSANTPSSGNITFLSNLVPDSTISTMDTLKITAAEGIATFVGKVESNGKLKISAAQYAFGNEVKAKSTEKIELTGEVYLFGTPTLGNETSITGDLHIVAATTVSKPLTATNIVLYSGNLALNTASPITTTKDLVLLNSKSATTMYSNSGIADLFRYDHPKRDKKITADNDAILAWANVEIKEAFPNTVPSTYTFTDGSGTGKYYAGSLTNNYGNTITVGGNFYDNGASITASQAWKLKIPSNDNATVAFAEAYNMTVQNCTVEAISGSHAVVAAAENCSGTNTDIDLTDGAGWAFVSPALSTTNIKTLSDSIIRIEINDPNALELKFENSSGEIAAAVAAIKSGNGNEAFAGAYIDEACTKQITAATYLSDIAVFYLQTAAPAWNTDATGSSAGAAESTDSAGVHHVYPADLEIPRATTALFQTLRDSNKNRLPHYGSTSRFVDVTDSTPPVVVAVYLGQEPHKRNTTGNPTSQTHYDGHNFIEFRYSEPVTIGGVPTTDTSTQVGTTFTTAAAVGGAITSSSSGLDIAGYGKIAGGSLSANSPTAHSVYRYFSTKSNGTISAQTHRVRIGIAAFTSTDDSTARNWEGYVTKITAPAEGAAVTVPANQYITDNATPPNILDQNGSSPKVHKTVPSSGIDSDNDFITGWDTLPPTIATYTDPAYAELAASDPASSGKAQYLEFRLLDSPNPLIGGIRYSTWVNALGDFKYTVAGGALKTGTHFDNQRQLLLKYFTGQQYLPIGDVDSPYFSFDISAANAAVTDEFTLQYKSSSAPPVTDIAGNAMEFPAKKSIKQIPLKILLTIAPHGEKRLALIFSSKIELFQTAWYGLPDTGTAAERKAAILARIPTQLTLSGVSGISIDSATPAVELSGTGNSTVLLLSLTSNVTLADLKTGIITATGTAGFDIFNNKLTAGPAHALSDFAINVIEPLYAVENSSGSAGASGTGAVRDFSGAKNAFNKIPQERDVTIETKIADGISPADVTSVTMYLSIAPNAGSVASKFNALLGRASRVWLPTALPDFSENANPQNGGSTRQLTPDTPASPIFTFLMPNEQSTPGTFNWKDNVSVGFLFALSDGNIITINHDGDSSTPPVPLYALRLADPNDLLSIDLWSFQLAGTVQRGNVVIANNVINARTKEAVRIEVTMPSAGNLTLSIMTLDGNIVQYLHRGRESAGTHSYSWNGSALSGISVARGMYFVRIVGPGIDETRKVMVIKE